MGDRPQMQKQMLLSSGVSGCRVRDRDRVRVWDRACFAKLRGGKHLGRAEFRGDRWGNCGQHAWGFGCHNNSDTNSGGG